MRQRFPRQHLVAHGCVVNKDRFHRSRLRQIIRLQPFIQIHIGVVGPGSVIQRILNELEAGNVHRIKGLVIGTSGVPHRDGGDTQV